MARCETCGNDYDKAFQVVLGGVTHTFDSIECAAHPARSARARSPEKRDPASPEAGRSASNAKRASASDE